MKNGFSTILLLLVFNLLTACVPDLENTPAGTPNQLPTRTSDPSAVFTISAEINQRLSNEEIMNSLFSRWLEHLRGNRISAYWRIEAYDIEDISESSIDQSCAKKLGAVFLMEIQVYMKTTDPITCSTECEHSAWAAGGGNIIDAFSLTKPFSGAVFKSGNIYTLHVITDVPPCNLP